MRRSYAVLAQALQSQSFAQSLRATLAERVATAPPPYIQGTGNSGNSVRRLILLNSTLSRAVPEHSTALSGRGLSLKDVLHVPLGTRCGRDRQQDTISVAAADHPPPHSGPTL